METGNNRNFEKCFCSSLRFYYNGNIPGLTASCQLTPLTQEQKEIII